MSISSHCRSGRKEHRYVSTNRFLYLVSENLLSTFIPACNHSLERFTDNCVRGRLDNRGQAGSTEFNLSPSADVPKNQHHAYKFTTIITAWCSTVVDRKTPTGFRNKHRVVRKANSVAFLKHLLKRILDPGAA
jgi:hypothetical protein